jgi:transitional endoplasmic reticulum ATPase
MNFITDDFETPSGEGQRLRLVPLRPTSPLALEGAVCALRMIEGERWYGRLLKHNGIRDDDVLEMVGLEPDSQSGSEIKVIELRVTLDRHRTRLERRLRHAPDKLARNIEKLASILKLNPAECRILRLSVIVTQTKHFADFFQLVLASQMDLMRAVRSATGLKFREVVAAFANNRPLRRSGFFANWSNSFNANPLELEQPVIDALLASTLDEERFLRRLVRAAPASSLTMADFTHLPDLALLQRYLTDATTRKKQGVNILLYGAPGTGKTEFVRALRADLGLDLYEVPNEDSDGDPLSGRRRFTAYTVCQNLLASRRKQLLMFDEVEDVFGSSGSSFGAMFGLARARDPEELRKSWVNETLERNPVPAIWVCNSIDAIDAAFLRRFDLIMEFMPPTRAVRRRIIDRHFRMGEISTECAERLASIDYLPPAQVERAARVVRSLRTRVMAKRDAEVERVVMASLKAMGHGTPICAPSLPGHYDPAFLNTDRNLDTLTAGLQRGGGARLCLYGPPGSGKTAFAHHLGRFLDRPVLIKRGSDLLSKYIGGTEKAIANAFRDARVEDAILVIDEADGFLRDRSGAKQPWEVTQVNELLTQMEAFDGIFIASTNLIDTLDAASLRRFDFKVKFDYLRRDQRRAFLSTIALEASADSTDSDAALSKIDHLDLLTPGDFSNVLRQLQVTREPVTASRLVALLSAEVAMKPQGHRRPIGFV